MHRTTLIIDDELLREAMQLTGAGTKTEVVELALKELVRARSRTALREELGTFHLSITLEELQRLRNAG
jgi:Arc/MetJ family transcription regulator